jgi:hypothetical protein
MQTKGAGIFATSRSGTPAWTMRLVLNPLLWYKEVLIAPSIMGCCLRCPCPHWLYIVGKEDFPIYGTIQTTRCLIACVVGYWLGQDCTMPDETEGRGHARYNHALSVPHDEYI